MSQQTFTSGFDDITDTGHTQTPPYSKVMVGTIVVLFLVIFFILMLHIYAKWFFQPPWRSSTISRRRIVFISPSAAASAHVNTALDNASIAQLPTFVYKANSAHVNTALDNAYIAGNLDESVAPPSLECAVCLNEFQENEKGRMLPSCKHTFHTECIDMWFLSHSTCPLCRTEVVLAMPTSPNTACTHEQQHEGEEQEAMEPLPGTTEGNPVVSNAVEQPCNVLFWGDQTQVVSSQEPSSSSLPFLRSLRMSSARALPQITIDIPPMEGNFLVSTSGPVSPTCTTEEEAGSSQPLKSPGLRASIKRMLSRQT